LEPDWGSGRVGSLRFSADGRTLVVGRPGGEFAFVDAVTGRRRTLVLEDESTTKLRSRQVHFSSLSPDERRAFTVESDPSSRESFRVCVWETSPPRLVASPAVPTRSDISWTPL